MSEISQFFFGRPSYLVLMPSIISLIRWNVTDLWSGKKKEAGDGGKGLGPEEDYLDVDKNKASSALEYCVQR